MKAGAKPTAKPVKIQPTYTLSEVARLLERPQQTVSDWAKKGLLLTVMLGSRQVVPLAALQAHGIIWESIKLSQALNAALTK